MAKGKRNGGQPPEDPPNPPEVPEGEPRVDLGEEDMDPETMRNLISTMQVEMNTLRSNQENVTQTFILQKREMERQRQELAAQALERGSNRL